MRNIYILFVVGTSDTDFEELTSAFSTEVPACGDRVVFGGNDSKEKIAGKVERRVWSPNGGELNCAVFMALE